MTVNNSKGLFIPSIKFKQKLTDSIISLFLSIIQMPIFLKNLIVGRICSFPYLDADENN